jgi:hypothetical protein
VRTTCVGLRVAASHEDRPSGREGEVVGRRACAVEEALLLLVVGVMVVGTECFDLLLLELETLLVLLHRRHLWCRQGTDLAWRRFRRLPLAHGTAHRVGAGLWASCR